MSEPDDATDARPSRGLRSRRRRTRSGRGDGEPERKGTGDETRPPPDDAHGLPESVLVRPMTEEDLERVCAIEKRSFSVPWKPRTFRRLLPRDDAELWVAELDSGVIGYFVLWFVTDEGELADLAVDPEYRRRGVGGFLVDEAVHRARSRGVRSLFLEVRASNEGALSLYRSRGFHVISVRKGYYSKPREDARVMLKSLW